MLKKSIYLGLLGLLVILLFSSTAYANTDSINPFSSFDKANEERLLDAKDMPDQVSMQKNLSTEEFQSKENKVLESSGKRYIIKFKDDSSLEQIYTAINQYDYEILGKSHNRLFVLELNDIQHFQEQSSDIIEFVEEDLKVKTNIESSDTYYPYQWALPTTNIPKVWEISKGSNSVYVAVIDSGIYRNQPDLINTDIRNGWDYIFYDYCDWDSTSHGTNVTGIIGAETNNAKGIAGVNWNVAIIPLRVVYTDGTAYTSNTIAAIYDAADLECDVINLSLGNSYYSSAESLAVSYAISKGSIVVASAGNEGTSKYNYPASYNDVISVGSIDTKLKVSNFSQHNNMVDVTAPGENILTTSYWIHDQNGDDYSFVDGTSFSAPYVSGIAALMKAVKPSITAGEFMGLLKTTSTDFGAPGYDNYYGYGLINAEKILQSISTVPVQSIVLNKNSLTLNVGASDTLKATISPANASNHNISWKSSNPSVATVHNGIVRAISNGTSIISVTSQDGSKRASCTVKVETTTSAMDLDLFNLISKNRHSFYSFVDSPIIFDEVLTNWGDFLIAFEGSYYKVSDVQKNLDSGAAHFEEAIRGLTPVEFNESSKIEVVKVNVIDINLNVGDKFSLPAKVAVEVEGKKETKEMEVEWDGLIDTTKVRDYTITGNLILPEGYINPKGIVALAKVNVKAKDGPITVDQIPYNIEILEPNSIGTIWMQATYKNNTDYPITSFRMKVLLKDENETTYLTNYDTVLPGETSPLFDTFGPNSMKMSDIEILTIDARLETPDGKRLGVDYDTKLRKYDYSEYDSDYTDNAPILVDQVPYNIEILEPNSIGTVWMQATYKNNTDYPITNFQMKVLLKDENETTYLTNYDTVLPGETSPLFDTFGPNSMKMSDIEILTIEFRAETQDNTILRVEYNTKLNKYDYSEY